MVYFDKLYPNIFSEKEKLCLNSFHPLPHLPPLQVFLHLLLTCTCPLQVFLLRLHPAIREALPLLLWCSAYLSLCGSVTLLCGGLLSVIGIVLGALGMNSKGKGMAIAGIVLSALGLLLTIIFRVVFRGILFNHYWLQLLHSFGM